VAADKVEIIVVHAVVAAAAGVAVEIPTKKAADVVGGTCGRMRAVGDDAAGGDVGVLTTGQLFVGFKNIKNARAIARVEGEGAAIGPIAGFKGAVQQESLEHTAIGGGVRGGATIATQTGLEQNGGCAGDKWSGITGFLIRRGL